MKTKQQQRKKRSLARKGAARKAIPRPQKVSRGLEKDPDLRAYELALLDPFDVRAEGARVPDLYTTPTACYHLRGTVPMRSDSNGNSALTFLPSPLVSLIDLGAMALAGSSVLGSSMNFFVPNPAIGYATTADNIQGIYSAMRIVAAGWKVRVVVPPLNRAGKIFVVPLPVTDEVPGWNALSQYAASVSKLTSCLLGSPSPVALSSPGILGLPGAKEYSLEELAQNDLILRDRPTSARYFDFHNTNTDPIWQTGVYNYADSSIVAGSSVIPAGADKNDPTRMAGHTAYVIVATGVPPSTAFLDVEYVYHLEGAPAIGNTTIVPIPSGAAKVVSEPFGLERILAAVSSQPFIEVVQAGLDTFLPTAGAIMRTVRYL